MILDDFDVLKLNVFMCSFLWCVHYKSMRYTTFSSPRPYKGISYAIEENNAASVMCYIDSFDFFQEHTVIWGMI